MLYNILYFLLLSLNHVFFLYIVFRLKIREVSIIILWSSIILGVFLLITAILTPFFKDYVQIVYIVPCFLLCIFIFKTTLFNVLKYLLIAFPGITILGSSIKYFFLIILKFDIHKSDIVSLVFVVVALLAYYFLIAKHLPENIFQVNNKIWIFISISLFIIVGMISYFINILPDIKDVEYSYIGTILITVGSLVIFISLFMILLLSNLKNKYEQDNYILEKFNRKQKWHFERLLTKELKTKKFRHDIDADIIQVYSFLMKQEYLKAKKYLEEMNKSLINIKKITFSVGNEIIDTLLNYHLQPICEESTVNVYGVVDNEISIRTRNLCVIITNVLQNAVEAVIKVPKEKRIIFFEVNQGSKYLNIVVKNSFDSASFSDAKVSTLSTKKDKNNHGFGFSNIYDALKEIDGDMNSYIEKGLYTIDISLKINRRRHKH